MTKYSILLLGSDKDAVLTGIRDLGMLDITRSVKPVDKESERMLGAIGDCKAAIAAIDKVDFSSDADAEAISKVAGAAEPFTGDFRQEVESRAAAVKSAASTLSEAEKESALLKPWGSFKTDSMAKLKSVGIDLHFYCVSLKKYSEQWKSQWAIGEINRDEDNVWFVVAGDAAGIPATECAPLEYDFNEVEARIADLRGELISAKGRLLALKAQLPQLEKACTDEINALNLYLASASGEKAVEDTLCVLTGFAPTEDDARIAESLSAMDLYYLSEPARKEDNPPIKLKNNWFARLFETLTGMYGMPVYDEFDPTPILAPFFMLFWAFCMGDAGYGLVLIGVGFLLRKVDIMGLKNHWKLVVTLGVGATVIGFFLATFFGISLAEASWVPAACKKVMLAGKLTVGGAAYDVSMVAAIAVGVFHICLAMVIKAIGLTKRFGFKEAISTWGWIVLIIGGILVAAGALTSVLNAAVTKWAIIVIGVVSALGIFIFNKPGRNPLLNIGAGLWDTYGMATGILGDVLSYIRLYALGLAGGMLGGAFNNLGAMVLGPNPTWQWLAFILIVVFGHALNFAMSCLGAFVHPLRLTFVEYFKNSGYEGKGVKYNPLKKEN